MVILIKVSLSGSTLLRGGTRKTPTKADLQILHFRNILIAKQSNNFGVLKTLMKIDTDDASAINQIKKIVVQQFHIDIQIDEELNATVHSTKTRGAEFAEKMDWIF